MSLTLDELKQEESQEGFCAAGDEYDDTEEDLGNALSLLEDCGELLGLIALSRDKTWPNVINTYIYRRIVKVGQEVEALLNEYNMGTGDERRG